MGHHISLPSFKHINQMKQENKYQPEDYTFLFIQKFLKTIKQNYNCLTTFGTSSTTITRHDSEEEL